MSVRQHRLNRKSLRRTVSILLATGCALSGFAAHAAVVVRERMDDGVFAAIRDGQFLFLECRPPDGDAAESFFVSLLADTNTWRLYRDRQSVAVPYPQLNGATQRVLIERLFPYDYCDEAGWWHTVSFSGSQGQETWHAIADWFTGRDRAVAAIMRHEKNLGKGAALRQGDRILIPHELLKEAFRALSPNRPAPPPEPAAPLMEPIVVATPAPAETVHEVVQQTAPKPEMRAAADPRRQAKPEPEAAPQPAPAPKPEPETKLAVDSAPEPEFDRPAPTGVPVLVAADAVAGGVLAEGEADSGPVEFADSTLVYGKDDQGEYAAYPIQRGEAVYTSVVVRFTDYRTNEDIHDACRIVLARSGIADPRKIEPGEMIRIPLEMLSDRYWPKGSVQRSNYDSVRVEAERQRGQRVESKDLDGVVVIIDPGHGGEDTGAMYAAAGLYEDELNYDIACRLKETLETNSRAKVYMTLTDPKQGFNKTDATRFAFDRQEELLTNPRYLNQNAKISANLRWYLANDIYNKELKGGIDPRKVVFISIHCDALFANMRGTMIYVPGAKYRRDRELPSGVIYASYLETNGHSAVTTTGEDRTRDEAVSRNFAEVIIKQLRNANPQIAVNRHGDPIRNVIRQGKNTAYVPAVLRNNLVPTKVLLETANMNNPTDRERLADPDWRGWYAEAIHRALLEYFEN
ncbi:MAG: hypothetical protein GC168_13930 [Candidatus Hydrogenedens sp.]|nr:hypothetical protein [Candidatus Hydrogenedens sp.]